MAEATLRFFDETFDLDIMKVMPDIPYPFAKKSIQQSERLAPPRTDRRLPLPLLPATGRVRPTPSRRVGYDTPIIMTVFSPLCEAMYFAADRERFLAHIQDPAAVVHEALSVIAENLRAHIADVIEAGADGVFLALQGCTRTILTEAQYREFGRPTT